MESLLLHFRGDPGVSAEDDSTVARLHCEGGGGDSSVLSTALSHLTAVCGVLSLQCVECCHCSVWSAVTAV